MLAAQVIKALESRNMEGWYFEDRAAALNKALSLIPQEGLVSCGGSETLKELGLREGLKIGGYNFLDPLGGKDAKGMDAIARRALDADCYFMSANAIAATGEMVNIDGYGNRIAALIFGPKRVVVVAGMNKVVPDLDAAIHRARNVASQKCVALFSQEYASFDAMKEAAELAQSHIVLTKRSALPGRISVILVGEDMGL
jgi:hypothetical protein